MGENTEPYHYDRMDMAGEMHGAVSQDFIECSDYYHHTSLWPRELIPKRLISVFLLCCLFTAGYYHMRCERYEDGSFISQPLYMPKTTRFPVLEAYLPMFFKLEVEESPTWQMPKMH